MQHAFGMAVPESVAEMCQPPRSAVLVYDAQVGIVAHVQDRVAVLSQIRRVVDAARTVGVPVLYVRHVSVPPSHMGVGALRAAMAWQRVARAEDVRSSFPSEAGHAQLVDDRRSRGCVVGHIGDRGASECFELSECLRRVRGGAKHSDSAG
jgi:biuret amidohydrolase